MKYSKEQKLKWAKAYREGKLDHSMAPAGVKYKNFLTMVRRWEKLSTLHGDDAVTAGHRKRKYPATYKLRAVARVQAGESAGEVARALGITSNSVVQQWVETYRLLGAKGLESKPKGRKKHAQEETQIPGAGRIGEAQAGELHAGPRDCLLKKLRALAEPEERSQGRNAKPSSRPRRNSRKPN